MDEISRRIGLTQQDGPRMVRECNPIGRAVNAHPVPRETRPVVVEESMLQTDAAAVGAASTIFHDAFTPRVSGSSQARRLPK